MKIQKILTALSLLLVTQAKAETAVPVAGSVTEFRNFAGYCQGNTSPLLTPVAGWDRHDLSWGELQPKPGEWKQEYLEQWGRRVLQAQVAGQKLLPVLGYNASWSWDRNARDYEFGDLRKEIRPRPDGQFDVRTLKRNKAGAWAAEKTEVQAGNSRWPLAEEHVKDWENYVRKTVTFLRAAPYNVEYFQIWNEAHPLSGFWEDDLDSYMTRVHLPAAKIIHELGGKVVYGGWPICGSLQTYSQMLDRHDAWKSIDVHDMHYFGVLGFEHLWQAAAERRLTPISIWQTEVGFTPNFGFVANNYPRFLHWALSHQWTKPDQFKLFFFACWTPNDPKSYGYNKSLLHGSELSPHGQSLTALAHLFEGGPLQLYTDIVSTPPLTTQFFQPQSFEAFRIGKRLIIAIHNMGGDTLNLNFPKLAQQQVTGATRIDLVGGRLELKLPPAAAALYFKIEVPLQESAESRVTQWFKPGQSHTFFVELQLE